MANAYAVGREPEIHPADIPDDMGPDPNYGAPPDGDHYYYEYSGWSPKLAAQSLEIPDAQREQAFPIRDFREDERQPSEFWRRRNTDRNTRESSVDSNAIGWEIRKKRKNYAPNPRLVPTEETRPTQGMSPTTYTSSRLWDQLAKGNGARTFNGRHFSMADHRRNYDVLGMQPVITRRNTMRLSPPPWDENMYDGTAVPYSPPVVRYPIDESSSGSGGNRAWRL